MNKIALAVVGCLMSAAAVANGVSALSTEFTQVDAECSALAQAFVKDQSENKALKDHFDVNACYSWSVKTAMIAAPEQRETILMAALQASEMRAAEVVEGAINSGMAPMVVVARATEALPKRTKEIAQGAIMAGVDPVVVTEATAAGYPHTSSKTPRK